MGTPGEIQVARRGLSNLEALRTPTSARM